MVLSQPAVVESGLPIHGAKLQNHWARQHTRTVDVDLYTELERPGIIADGLSFRIERNFSAGQITKVKVENEADKESREED
ncbi:MAG TPA: hypothetical protein VE954_00700 [Oligoflexus sp.]|nr:hypothetical protein [Oligoflexus sp.]